LAHRNRTRAARRNAERRKKNEAAIEAAIELAEDRAERPKRKFARSRTILETLEARGAINLDQKRAGDKLAKDYVRSNTTIGRLIGHYEANMPRRPGYGAPPDTPMSIVARERYDNAMKAVGPRLNSILFHVCVTDLAPIHWGPPNGEAAVEGPKLLRVALDALITFYDGGSRRLAA
jgi:hypothetical protein